MLGNTGERGVFVLPLRVPGKPGEAEVAYDDFTFEAASWTLTAHEARPGHELQFAAMVDTYDRARDGERDLVALPGARAHRAGEGIPMSARPATPSYAWQPPRRTKPEPPASMARTVLGFLRDTLLPHASAEEEVLYPEWARLVGFAEAAVPMVHDHEAIVDRIRRLGETEPCPHLLAPAPFRHAPQVFVARREPLLHGASEARLAVETIVLVRCRQARPDGATTARERRDDDDGAKVLTHRTGQKLHSVGVSVLSSRT